MRIQLEREILLKPVGMVASVVERRQTLPILAYTLIKTLDGKISFTGTDLEVEVLATAPAVVDEPGEFTLPARKLFDICRALPAGALVGLSKQGDKVILKSGKSRFSLSTLSSAEFPIVEVGQFEHRVGIDQVLFKNVIERTAFCMAQQDVRYYLNGLYVEIDGKRLRAVATDGHRMAITECVIDAAVKPLQVIVPRKGILEISRLLASESTPIHLEIGLNHVRVGTAEVTLTSKLIDGKFPDYTKVVPSSQSKLIRLDKQILKDALTRAAILANEKYRGVRLSLEPGSLRISAHNPEQEEAVEEIETTYSGDAMEIGFNVTYLLDATNAITSSEVVLGLNDPNSSCTLRPSDDPHTQYIVMPMRL
jgi:DNA polymerase-3 subunit beta